MAWDFETEPAFQEQLDWMSAFVREHVEPLDLVFRGPADPFNPSLPGPKAAMAPLKRIVKERGLWACHLGPELGGKGFGQVKLGLMNEILGRSRFAPTVFGTQAPDTGNAEILARFGTAAQKSAYLQRQRRLPGGVPDASRAGKCQESRCWQGSHPRCHPPQLRLHFRSPSRRIGRAAGSEFR